MPFSPTCCGAFACLLICFKEGMGTIDEVLAAQTAWLKANSEKIDAEINVQLTREYLDKVMGTMTY